VISKTHRRFWDRFRELPAGIQELARSKYRLWARDPFHPPLQFKPLLREVWSVRIGPNYRALARRKGELVVWFWIGTHEEYDRFITQLR